MYLPEYYTNTIIKIYHDAKTNTLALLKFRDDASLYVALINLNDNTIELVDILHVFVKNGKQLFQASFYKKNLMKV